MITSQKIWSADTGWKWVNTISGQINPTLILYFGTRQVMESGERYQELKEQYPHAVILGCTSGGEILNDKLYDNTVVASLIEFEKTPIRYASTKISSQDECEQAGETIAKMLKDEALAGIFVLSDGLNVNGSALVSSMCSVIGNHIPITGGLAGDGSLFELTLVGVNAPPTPGTIAAIGFYGPHIRTGQGSISGWDAFGPKRIITKSERNILYELDGKPALSLYKKYLGEESEKLPGSALLFPLSIKADDAAKNAVIRTVLSIDEGTQSMYFAGNIPEGYIAQLMHGNFDRLIEGASNSAQKATLKDQTEDQIGILISCIGRRLLMGQYTIEEIEAVYNFWDKKVPLVGFYSYGEISPHPESQVSELHNQTMTITTFGEI